MEVVSFVFAVGFFFFALYVVAVTAIWTATWAVVAVQALIYIGVVFADAWREVRRGETTTTPPPWPWRWP